MQRPGHQSNGHRQSDLLSFSARMKVYLGSLRLIASYYWNRSFARTKEMIGGMARRARILIMGTVFSFGLLLFQTPAIAQQYDLTRHLRPTDAAAFDYFKSLGAYYLPTSSQLRAGDTWFGPQNVIEPDRFECFGLDPTHTREAFHRKSDSPTPRTFFVKGAFDILVWQFGGDVSVQLISGLEFDFEHFQIEYVKDPFQYSSTNCPWMNDVLQSGTGDGQHLTMAEVYRVRGWMQYKSGLRIDGHLEFDGLRQLKEKLFNLAVLDDFPELKSILDSLSAGASIDAGYEANPVHERITMPSTRNVAFKPFTINRLQLERHLRAYYNIPDVLRVMEAMIGNPEEATLVLQNYGSDFDLIMESGTPKLLGPGEHIGFDRSNPDHLRAFELDVAIVVANHYLAGQ